MQIFFIIFIAVIYIVINIAKEKEKARKKQEAARTAYDAAGQRADAGAARTAPAYAAPQTRMSAAPAPTVRVPSGSSWHCVCGRDNDAQSAFCVKCGRKKAEGMSGSLVYTSSEGGGRSGSLAGGSSEGVSFEGSKQRTKPSLKHVVEPMQSRHTHMETSMTGIEELCEENYTPPIEADAYMTGEGGKRDAYDLDKDREALAYGLKPDDRNAVLAGLLYSEILSKPKALRRRA